MDTTAPDVIYSALPGTTSTIIDDGAFEDVQIDPPPPPPVIGGFRFWMIFISLMVSTFLAAIDLTSVSVTLPTIVADLHGTDFAWVGSAFTLGSTAVIPLTGGLAQIFGRRSVLLSCLFIFGVGSAVCGAAHNMGMLIAGRAVQGIGAGGILSLTEIVVADLVPLAQRGLYVGLIGAVWAVAGAIGPPIGGAFAQSNWRWLFYLNLPLTAIAAVIVSIYMRLKIPQDDLKTKLGRMDWIGNFIIIASTSITVVALTWGGVKYSWGSYQVLVPLIIGILGTALFFWYEANVAVEPVIPWILVNNRTAFFGYLIVFWHSIAATTIIYYLVVYFQGALLQRPLASGISLFANAFTIAPALIVCGISVTKSGKYLPQNLIGWGVLMIGLGLLSTLKATSPKSQWVGYQIIEGFGLGIIYAAPTYPVLAAAPVTETAHALSLFVFIRKYGQTWGVQLGATILQNQLTAKLPSQLLLLGDGGGEVAYELIPLVPSLRPESLKTAVRKAFAESMGVVWLVLVGISGVGFLCVFGMKELPMHKVTDEDWGMEDRPTGDGKAAGGNADLEKMDNSVASSSLTLTLMRTRSISCT